MLRWTGGELSVPSVPSRSFFCTTSAVPRSHTSDHLPVSRATVRSKSSSKEQRRKQKQREFFASQKQVHASNACPLKVAMRPRHARGTTSPIQENYLIVSDNCYVFSPTTGTKKGVMGAQGDHPLTCWLRYIVL